MIFNVEPEPDGLDGDELHATHIAEMATTSSARRTRIRASSKRGLRARYGPVAADM